MFGWGKANKKQLTWVFNQKTMYRKLRTAFLKWRAVRNTLYQYEYVAEVNKLLEDFTTKKLLQGGSAEFMKVNRENLVTIQKDMKRNNEFIEYLRTQ